MSDFGALTATVRDQRGKGAARTLRREGLIPAVMYGGGKDNVSLALNPLDFNKATDPERLWNTLYTVTVKAEGKPDVVEPCVLVDVQLDSIRSDVLHIDFMRVDPEADVVRKVPVRVTGRSIGITKGGKLKKFRRTVKIAAKPTNVPVELVVDITAVDAGESVRMQDVTLEGARLVEDPQARLCFIELPKARKEDEEEGKEGEKKKE